jgi:hypothetical protein
MDSLDSIRRNLYLHLPLLFMRCRSKNYIIRLFYFEFLMLFYNLWIFVNILIFFLLYKDIRNDPIVVAKDFVQLMFDVDPG